MEETDSIAGFVVWLILMSGIVLLLLLGVLDIAYDWTGAIKRFIRRTTRNRLEDIGRISHAMFNRRYR